MTIEMDAVRAALDMTADDIRLLKTRTEQQHPEIGYHGMLLSESHYGKESNDFSQFAICYLWLRRCDPLQWIGQYDSYSLKHVVEADAGRYITNGAVILAAAARGIPFIRCGHRSPNATLGLVPPRIVNGRTWPLLEQKPDPKIVTRLPRVRRSDHPERSLVTYAVRARIMERDGFRCRRCGNGPQDAKLVVDHIEPVSKGGRSTDGNLQTLCEPCNIGKGARDPHPHDFIS